MWKRRDNLRMPLAVLLASRMAIPIAYYFLIGGFAPTSEPEREAGLASIAPRLDTTTEFPIPKEEVRPSGAEGDNTLVPSRNKLLDEKVNSPRGAKSSVAETPAALPPSPPPDPDALAGAVVRELDPDSIKLLMQKGSQFVMSGDLVSALSSSYGRRKPATRPPLWRWAQLTIRSGSRSAGRGALAPILRRREAGTNKQGNSALPTLHTFSKCWQPASKFEFCCQSHGRALHRPVALWQEVPRSLLKIRVTSPESGSLKFGLEESFPVACTSRRSSSTRHTDRSHTGVRDDIAKIDPQTKTGRTVE
jgi:hypothetical protein